MDVIIYQQSRNTMQSGRGKTALWLMEFTDTTKRTVDNLIGWIGCADTNNQIMIRFPNSDKAVEFANKNDLEFTIRQTQERIIKPRSFADNYKYIPVEE